MSAAAEALAREVADLKRRLQAIERASQTPFRSFETSDGQTVNVAQGIEQGIAAATTADAAAQEAADAQTAADAANAAATQASTDAAAAQSAASAAQSAANAAQTTANGKNAVYFDTAPPTGGTYKVGDLWLDTDNGYALSRWDGATWTASPYGTGALATGSITADLLAAGSVVAGKIASAAVSTDNLQADAVTAEKIAADTITAAEIAAGAIGASEIAANAVQASHIAAGQVQAGHLAANSVTAGAIAATAIDGKTITGATLRTASSGRRIDINSTDFMQVNFFTGDADEKAQGEIGVSVNPGESGASGDYGYLFVTAPAVVSGSPAAYASNIFIAGQQRGGAPGHITLDVGGAGAGTINLQGDTAASRLAKGTGALQGTNYASGLHSAAFSVGNASWQTLAWNTFGDGVEDDGNLWNAGTSAWTSQAKGVYTLSLQVSFAANTNGRRLGRFVTQGGSVLSQGGSPASTSGMAFCNVSVSLPGGGYYVTPQTYQDSGAALNAGPNAAGSPTGTTMAQVA